MTDDLLDEAIQHARCSVLHILNPRFVRQEEIILHSIALGSWAAKGKSKITNGLPEWC